MSAGTVTVPLRPGSDGDASHRPNSAICSRQDPTLYLEKLGHMWMEHRGEAASGIKYVLEGLPAGYELWGRPRPSNSQIDRWLYGHPGHKVFFSPSNFFPHFLYLMDHAGSNIGCSCVVCLGQGRSGTFSGNFSSKQPTRAPKQPSLPVRKGPPKLLGPGGDTSRVDEEGTPDVYRNLIDRLEAAGSLDEPIKEPLSLDWRAEQELLPRLGAPWRDSQWIPRTGEVVLFIRELAAGTELCHDSKSDAFRIYDHNKKSFIGVPKWEAGVVTQPCHEDAKIDDLVMETDKKMSVSWSGLRIEPLPDPNNTDKSESKRYKYVPLHHTRPFVFWNEFLGDIPEEHWHPTIRHALKTMSVFSLIDKHRFRGTWPSAVVYCRAIFIGPEMIMKGDTVRLMPKDDHDDTAFPDVLVVNSIRLKLFHLDLASDNDYDEGRPYNSTVYLTGRGFTRDRHRVCGQVSRAEYPKSLREYQGYYPLHETDKEMQVPLRRILGRSYERPAMTLWFPQLSPDGYTLVYPGVGCGFEGVLRGRKYAREHDQRIKDAPGDSWFWADSRAEALDLETINGLETSKHDPERDPSEWRKMLKATEEIVVVDTTKLATHILSMKKDGPVSQVRKDGLAKQKPVEAHRESSRSFALTRAGDSISEGTNSTEELGRIVKTRHLFDERERSMTLGTKSKPKVVINVKDSPFKGKDFIVIDDDDDDDD